ncbi:Ninein-like protein [Nymphon striatum]|nr:Ninein-like protein [Nymphon striatum]
MKPKTQDMFLKGSEELTGKLKEDFDRSVAIQVNELWQKMLQGGEVALSGQLKEDFNNILYSAVHKIRESLRNQYNEEHEKIQHHLIEENNKMKENLTRDKKMMQLNYEEQLNSLKKSEISCDEPNRTDILLKNLFVENASLVKALQITEERQLKAEQSNMRLQKKCRMLSKVLSDVTRAAVS